MSYNQLYLQLDRQNSSRVIEFQHPATGQWADGTPDGSNPNRFSVTFTGLAAGQYSNLVGRLKGTSITATYPGPVTVANPPAQAGNQKPSVSFSPSTSSTPTVGAQKDYLALATDQDGTVSLVELVQVTSATDLTVLAVLAQDASSPYNLSWTPTTAGTVYLAARATDNQGAQSLSSVLTTTVQAAPVANVVKWLSINGQSNAVSNAELTEAQYPPMDTLTTGITNPFTNVYIWQQANRDWELLQEGVNSSSNSNNAYGPNSTYPIGTNGVWPDTSAASYNFTGIGAEYGLARRWEAANPGVPLYIFKYGEGGTSLDRWLKSAGDLYPKMLDQKQAAEAALVSAGKTVQKIGFYRNQGEADLHQDPTAWGNKLTQYYADLSSDGFVTADTLIVEAGTPVTQDPGTSTPLASPLNAPKQAFVNQDTSKRRYLDPAFVALEHDEIHWNLASQWYAGNVLLPNLLFTSGAALPASVTPAAPTLSYDSGLDTVTVTPPTSAWKMREFYYSLNGATPVRLKRSWAFPLGGVSYAPGQVRVWSRPVPGRTKSADAVNTTTWVAATAGGGFPVTAQGAAWNYGALDFNLGPDITKDYGRLTGTGTPAAGNNWLVPARATYGIDYCGQPGPQGVFKVPLQDASPKAWLMTLNAFKASYTDESQYALYEGSGLLQVYKGGALRNGSSSGGASDGQHTNYSGQVCALFIPYDNKVEIYWASTANESDKVLIDTIPGAPTWPLTPQLFFLNGTSVVDLAMAAYKPVAIP